ncbi:hypothetical protein ABPG75_006388 [Micractinium tetrahymenae]
MGRPTQPAPLPPSPSVQCMCILVSGTPPAAYRFKCYILANMAARRLLPAVLAIAALAALSGAAAMTLGGVQVSQYRDKNEAMGAATQLRSLLTAPAGSIGRRRIREMYSKCSGSQRSDDRRWKACVENLNKLVTHNLNRTSTYWRGINGFSRFSYSQLADKYLMKGVRLRSRPRTTSAVHTSAVDPGGIASWKNWEKENKSRAILDGANYPDYSEQQLLDCVAQPSYRSAGCNGGFVDDALDYISNNFIATEERYPYSERAGRCNAAGIDKTGSITLRSGYRTLWGRDDIMRAVSNEGPVVVYFLLVARSSPTLTSATAASPASAAAKWRASSASPSQPQPAASSPSKPQPAASSASPSQPQPATSPTSPSSTTAFSATPLSATAGPPSIQLDCGLFLAASTGFTEAAG